MPPEETSTATVDATPEAPASAETPATTTTATTDAPKATALETPETSLLEDVKAAREEAEGKKPEPEAEKPKDEAKTTEGDEKEPEFTTDAEKNNAAWLKAQRDKNLQEAQRLADERRAIDEAKAEVERLKAEIAAKPKTEEVKSEAKVDQPTPTALENFKPITLASYEDGDNENEQALKTGIEALAKDVQSLQTAQAEIAALKAQVDQLRQLADPFIPDEHGVTKAEVDYSARYLQGQAIEASEALMSEFGPDSGFKLDPTNLLAHWFELSKGFVNIGEIKVDEAYSKDAILKCWRHAHKTEIDGLKAAPAKPQEGKPAAPPIRKSEGQNAVPPSYEQMSEREKLQYDMKQEEALLARR